MRCYTSRASGGRVCKLSPKHGERDKTTIEYRGSRARTGQVEAPLRTYVEDQAAQLDEGGLDVFPVKLMSASLRYLLLAWAREWRDDYSLSNSCAWLSPPLIGLAGCCLCFSSHGSFNMLAQPLANSTMFPYVPKNQLKKNNRGPRVRETQRAPA